MLFSFLIFLKQHYLLPNLITELYSFKKDVKSIIKISKNVLVFKKSFKAKQHHLLKILLFHQLYYKQQKQVLALSDIFRVRTIIGTGPLNIKQFFQVHLTVPNGEALLFTSGLHDLLQPIAEMSVTAEWFFLRKQLTEQHVKGELGRKLGLQDNCNMSSLAIQIMMTWQSTEKANNQQTATITSYRCQIGSFLYKRKY